MRRLFALAILLCACVHPRLSVGYDGAAHTTGPLGNLQTIPRIAALTDSPTSATAPPEGHNYNLGLGVGDKRLSVSLMAHANNISGSTLDVEAGPQYMSAAAGLECRYNWLRWKYFATSVQVAPTRTLLVDSLTGNHSWGSGVRYGGGLNLSAKVLSLFVDVYQEKMFFFDGPAEGTSTRTGVTFGVAFTP